MMNKHAVSRQAGLTMLEVLIASVILCMLVMMASWLVWSTTDHISNTEAWAKTEMAAREVVDQMVKELHQCRTGKIWKIDTTKPIPTDTASMAALTSPGSEAAYPLWDPNSPTANTFDGIRFRIAGPLMELTGVTTAQTVLTESGVRKVDGTDPTKKVMYNNASADANGSADPRDPTGKKKIWNFDLKKFKANSNSNDAEWLYEITYWWEVDQQATSGIDKTGVRGEGKLDGNSPSGYLPDGVDNNLNGVVDEGVVKKMETWFLPDGSVERRIITTVCKDVTRLSFAVPGWPDWVNQNPANATAANAYKPGSEKTVTISLTISKADPRYPKDNKKTYVKTVTSLVDLRN